MKLGTYGDAEVHRNEKIVFVRFKKTYRVISTCRVNGGLYDDIECMFNHQLCEPAAHHRSSLKSVTKTPEIYLEETCQAHDLPERTVSLGTAANMNCAAIETARFRDLEVVAIATGGVETNAGRAGDPASVWEKKGSYEPLVTNGREPHGTINTMVLINQEVTKGAMVRTVMTATEAKTTVLQELGANSRYSDGLATGTGTDQIAVACPLTGETPLTSAGKHSKLGELIGKSVSRAIRKTLALQQALTPENQRSIKVHIERFGATKASMQAGIARHLPEALSEIFAKNFEGLNREPLVVAAACSFVHVRDKIVWGILPESCTKEILTQQGAMLAASISQKIGRTGLYYELLSNEPLSLENSVLLEFIYKSCAIGYEEKWTD
ncbi:protein of unknown function DUF105 [Chloroherpeton thalassium ATCC 35110]|uniref:Adenosylcobinamide amidohydrolase n=1 Tax=Chloroherpeton thalassium (strain ATCC 35110 / GB-78) TaxID=517418 RepID=B3QW30_CHLT3|nr:adenosylcobinamide amidohydrolase [Chloroherpeton thalassium]ACF14684.1 protein of unknown function DUF105 [Chloroherpeton thalassium ATCC 35110]